MLACLAFGALVGAINGALVVVFRASPVIVTMAMAMVLLGVMLSLTQTHAPGEAPEYLRTLGRWRLAGVPLRPAATFSVAFIVPADRPLSPVTRAFTDLVTATHRPTVST